MTVATNMITGKEQIFGSPCSIPFWYSDIRDYNSLTGIGEPMLITQ